MFIILGADGKEYGPVTAGKVGEWIAGSRASLQTKAKRAGESEWKTLGEFQEFASQSPSAAAVADTPPAPPAGAALSPATGLVLAGRWSRLGAQLLDGLIGCGFVLPGGVVLLAGRAISQNPDPNPGLLMIGLGLLGCGVLALLAIQIYLLTTRGQTLGKKLLGIRIVGFEDEANPGFVKAVLLRVFVNGVVGAVPVIGAIYSIVDICFIFRADKRCLHDLIAGTKVVDA